MTETISKGVNPMYRLRPYGVEAFKADSADVNFWNWVYFKGLNKNDTTQAIDQRVLHAGERGVILRNPEGPPILCPLGYYVVITPQGLRPYAPEVFEAMYEPV